MKYFYKALAARDYRFDGKFFVAVKTTGVYCRPICPARPKRENVIFFPDAASAEAAGYRPCLRCRPECAPLSPAWWGKRAVVQRALKLIANNGLHHQTNEDEFAERLGVSARHLRRLFESEIGRTPKQIADANRLNFARRLIVETPMPIITVAQSVGFASLRRFNDAFKKRFRRSPSQLRKGSKSANAESIELKLSFRPPYDWQSLLQFYRTHLIPGVEQVEENSFERIFRIAGSAGFVRVQPAVGKPQAKVSVVTQDPKILCEVMSRVRRMFDLDSDPMLIAGCFAKVPLLAGLVDRFPGLRVPGGWDPFETAVCSILGQVVSAEQRAKLVNQLVRGYGEAIDHPVTGERAYLFPDPATLASTDLSEVSTSAARRAAVRDFSRRVSSGAISLSEAQDPVKFRKALLETRGLGAWSAEYISLRSIGDTDAFPRTDLILKRVLALHPDLDLDLAKPWRAYAAIYLWKAFAQKLSKSKRRNTNDIILQRDGIACGQTQTDRQLRRARRRAMGAGTPGSREARGGQARSAPSDTV